MTAAARNAGALGACLSGAGPSILALCTPDTCEAVAAAYMRVAESMAEVGIVRQLRVVTEGAEIIDELGRVERPASQLETARPGHH
jgi:homoserine kinase